MEVISVLKNASKLNCTEIPTPQLTNFITFDVLFSFPGFLTRLTFTTLWIKSETSFPLSLSLQINEGICMFCDKYY